MRLQMSQENETKALASRTALEPSLPEFVIEIDFPASRYVGQFTDNYLNLLVDGTVIVQKSLALLAHKRHNPSVNPRHTEAIG